MNKFQNMHDPLENPLYELKHMQSKIGNDF